MRIVVARVVAVVAGLAVACGTVATTSLAAPLRHCLAPNPNAGDGPRDDRNVNFGNVTARGMTCSAALTRIRVGHLNPRFHTPGFSCKVVNQSQVGNPGHGGFITGQTIHCMRRGQAFQWSWAT